MLTFQIEQGLAAQSPARLIRQAVFVEEQGFSLEFDDLDASATHLVLYCDGAPVATGRLFPAPNPDSTYIIGRVAVLPAYRGQDFGRQVMLKLEEAALSLGAQHLELSAQTQAQAFYEKLGFIAQGAVYLDEHCPHIKMTKAI